MLSSKYERLINKFTKNKDDMEMSHIIQDKIYRAFITDVAKNKLSTEEITIVAELIHKRVIKHDKNRHYA